MMSVFWSIDQLANVKVFQTPQTKFSIERTLSPPSTHNLIRGSKRCTFAPSDLKAIPTYFLPLVCVLLAFATHAQTIPSLRCISLDDNDDVTLYWVQPSDTGADFNQYLVYYRSGSTAKLLDPQSSHRL